MMNSTRCIHTLSRLSKDLPKLSATIPKFKFNNEGLTVKQIADMEIGSGVIINGWIDKKPKKVGKNLTFCALRDTDGNRIQLVDSESLLKGASVEDVVQIRGKISPKKEPASHNNPSFEIKLNEVVTLNASNKKPSELQDFKNEGNYPPEFRFLQLRLPRYQRMLKKRFEITKTIRNSLDEQGFTEIETPVLFKSTPEGAREFLVPTRKTAGESREPTFYALPQSPQQYKQLLMASGVNRYFQIARCFRDEDLRADRQPEFTQVDLEMAFAGGEQVMNTIEKTVTTVWDKFSSNGDLLTLDNRGSLVPVKKEGIYRMTYTQAMTQYGIDKPDLRAPNLKILDLSEFKAYGYTNKEFPVFEILILRKAFDSMESFKEKWAFLSKSENYNFRTPIVVPIESEEDSQSWFEKFLPIATFENPKLVTKFLNLHPGDIVCGSTRQHSRHLFENPTPLGRLRQLVLQSTAGKQLFLHTTQDVATWVVDFPLFSPVEEVSTKNSTYPKYIEDQVTATHHPFTMVRLSDYEKLRTDPLRCSGQHYDLVVSGVELGGGSTRIHDPELQDYIFEEVLKIRNADVLFGHLLRAFRMGAPPHAGFAIGFDRMCAMLCGTESIRDVIAFPKSITGSDLVVGSPTTVDEDTLKIYNMGYYKPK